MNATTPTFTPSRPLMARVLNSVGGALRSLGMRRPRLDLDSLSDAAGFTPAPDDEDFLSRFRALLADAEGPARLNFIGRIAARRQFITLLRNRMEIRRWTSEHPETLDVPVERPLFVVGQARTGTTLLYNLLAQDPAARAPLLWELRQPVPPPDPATRASDPRIAALERELRSVLSLIPAVMTAHALDPHGPEECYHLLEYSAFSSTFLLYFDIPSYWNRLMAASAEEARAAYREFRRQVQILQLKTRGGHWLSKSPAHLFFLDPLLSAFPDGRIVLTHRDPLESIPSLCSLIAIVRNLCRDDLDAAAIGESTLGWYMQAWRRSEQSAAAAGGQVTHVAYRDLMKDPVGTVRGIYERLGYPFTPGFEERMRAWLAANPQHKHGIHRYSLEQFGLDRDRILRETEEYRRKRLAP